MVNPEITLDEIFAYLNQADKPCLVAIDEFQQINNYADNRIEALLRTYIQRCTNAHFIFSGSHCHLMAEMFTSPARPFYQSVTLMNLKPLDIEKYKKFATAKFEERNKHLDTAIIGELFTRFGGVTSYIQQVMNVLFLKTPEQGTCTLDMVDDAINYNLNMASDTYETLLRQMPEKQRNVFIHRHLCRGRSKKRKERSLRQKISSPVAKFSEFCPEGIAGERFYHPAG